jgi:hypothetical protein
MSDLVQLNILIDRDKRKQLKLIAVSQDMSITELLINLIDKEIQDNVKGEKPQ